MSAGAQGPMPVGSTATDWVLTFSDEFSGTSLDRSKWRSDYTNGANGELQQYVADDSRGNYVVSNGILQIIAKQDAYMGKQYTSGIITTQERFAQKYGYMEMRARMPQGRGLWPAFWMMPNPSAWPPELDVLEFLGQDTNTAYMGMHYVRSDGTRGEDSSYWIGPNFTSDWHVFAMDWEPNAIVWYIDGVERKRFSDVANIPSVAMHLLANMAVGGSWAGAPDGTTVFPAAYQIDYIRVWDKSSRINPNAPVNNMYNGSFEDVNLLPWYSPWLMRNDLGATFSSDTSTAASGSRSFKSTLTQANASQPWIVTVQQQNKTLNAGQTYRLSLWAKASAARPIQATVQLQDSPYSEFFNQTINLTTAWTQYTYTFTASGTTSKAMVNFNLAAATGSVWIDDVWFCPGTTCTPPPPTATPTNAPPTATPTSVPPTATATTVPPTATATSVPPTATATSVPPIATATAVPPTATATAVPPTPTPTSVPPTVDATPPSVSITSPLDGSRVRRNRSTTIQASASDNVGVTRVEFRVNGNLICSDSAAPYDCSWQVPSGVNITYVIEAKAYDAANNSATSTLTVTSR